MDYASWRIPFGNIANRIDLVIVLRWTTNAHERSVGYMRHGKSLPGISEIRSLGRLAFQRDTALCRDGVLIVDFVEKLLRKFWDFLVQFWDFGRPEWLVEITWPVEVKDRGNMLLDTKALTLRLAIYTFSSWNCWRTYKT